MRIGGLITLLVLVLAAMTSAQTTASFQDVPPWHWAYEAVRTGASAGIFVGSPADDREMAVNAIVQIYDSFAHAADPAAGEWVERFLINLSANWPEPLRRSRLQRFRVDGVRVEGSGDRLTVAFVATISLRSASGVADSRASIRADVRRDSEGRWKVNYASLAEEQPQLFK